MKITQAEWNKYIKTMSLLSDTASKEFAEWANNNGGWNAIDRNLMAEAAYQIASKYADSSSALAGEMYEAIANAENKIVKRAEMADEVDYGQLAKAINGALKHSTNDDFVSSPVGRAVKQAGADTMLKNASRDGAEFAWIPSGDSCPFCLVLASNGWRRASKKTTNGNHAEHIHTNCNCQFAIRFNKDTQIEGYDPIAYQKMYYDAEGNTSSEKMKSLQELYRAKQTNNSLTKSDILDKLSLEEQRALLNYKSSKSYILNEDLRKTNGDISKLSSEERKWIENLDNALDKMPNYSGDIVRVVDFSKFKNKDEKIQEFVDKYVVGEIISHPSYLSCSYKTDYNPNANIQMYVIDSKNGKDISSIGADEGEVLYKRDEKFATIQKELIDGVWYIILKER